MSGGGQFGGGGGGVDDGAGGGYSDCCRFDGDGSDTVGRMAGGAALTVPYLLGRHCHTVTRDVEERHDEHDDRGADQEDEDESDEFHTSRKEPFAFAGFLAGLEGLGLYVLSLGSSIVDIREGPGCVGAGVGVRHG